MDDLFGGLPETAPRPSGRARPVAAVPKPVHQGDLEPPYPAASLANPRPHGVEYGGKCRGGPLDGRNLYHAEPLYRLAFREGRQITYFGSEAEGLTFVWYHFVGGEWACIESAK